MKMLFRLLLMLILLSLILLGAVPAWAQEDSTLTPTEEVGTPDAPVAAVEEETEPIATAAPTEPPVPIVVEVPVEIPEPADNTLTNVILAVSVLGNILQFLWLTYNRMGGNVFKTIEAVKGDPDFQALLNKLADAPTKESLDMVYGIAMAVVKGAGAVEDVAEMVVDAVRPDGAPGRQELEFKLPEGIDAAEARQVITEALAVYIDRKKAQFSSLSTA